MAKDDKDPGWGSTHRPLPYRATLRVVESPDQPSVTMDWAGYAYSVTEAHYQALFETTEHLSPQSAVHVVTIGPDLARFWADAGVSFRDALAKAFTP